MSEPVSDCCSAPVTMEGRTTRYHVCSGCGQACDAVNADIARARTADELSRLGQELGT